MDSVFCPGCGNTLTLSTTDARPVAAPHLVRFGAGLIDFAISMVFLAIANIPGVGFIAAPLDCIFWLFRDVQGGSPGKSILGLEVRTQGGGVPTKGALILRNLPFAPLIVQAIPVIGLVVYPIMGVIILIEALLVLLTNRRLGDYLAGTMVSRGSASRLRTRSASAGL